MINVAFYSHTIDFAGTWRSHERLAEVLQHDKNFNVYILYSPNIENNRLNESKKILNNCKFVEFSRSLEKTDAELGWKPYSTNFSDVVKENKIQILHFARSGYYEWPFTERLATIQVETNIFGYKDNSNYLDGTIFIAKCLGINEGNTSILVPNPIPPVIRKKEISLRKEINIEEDTLVFGRIGRPANFSSISLVAFKAFKKVYKGKSKYIIIGPCKEAIKVVDELGLKEDVIFLDCTNDDALIEKFHETIDIFAHYRSDGEIHSTAISQAMMHGIPVITHFAGKNGQIEWLGPGGYFARNEEDYLKAMIVLSNQEHRKEIQEKAKIFAIENFEQASVVRKVKDFYLRILKVKNCEF
jgi:glycosyltransferase involved in cell wall biosynthesis